ncbi:MAG TPA: uroporphyrinogen decarboxylase family protein [Bryobacteraceae bacterium]|nr:uroporphyrinogen decarboxylase family protein [Bryobacteraceae bacterium]
MLIVYGCRRCGAPGFFRELHAAGGDVMGVDWRVNIDRVWTDISYRWAVQGNLDREDIV